MLRVETLYPRSYPAWPRPPSLNPPVPVPIQLVSIYSNVTTIACPYALPFACQLRSPYVRTLPGVGPLRRPPSECLPFGLRRPTTRDVPENWGRVLVFCYTRGIAPPPLRSPAEVD